MTDQSNAQSGLAGAGAVPHVAEGVGKVPHASASFGNVPKPSEDFRTVPHIAERNENHTLTVREVARLFEAAGVARTERSIVNWCQRDAQGFGKLDAYFDGNERKYFITPQSVDTAIVEEKAKQQKLSESIPHLPANPLPHASEDISNEQRTQVEDDDADELRRANMDLTIANRAKDFFIEQMKEERNEFVLERQGYVQQLMTFNRKVGELETQLLQLGAPVGQTKQLHVGNNQDIAANVTDHSKAT